MSRQKNAAYRLGLATLVMTLMGCAAVDEYSARAVAYNLEAEDALDKGLLLNIVRAIYQRPMQFTSVQSISGVASASGTAALTSIPIGPHSGTTPKIGTVSGTVSGGPTFTVPVLDTQEFYQGVMAPITSQLFDFYIHEEFPREEIFSLFVEKIVITRQTPDCIPPTGRKSHTLDCELVFVNNPNSNIDFDLFQTFVEHLVNLGLITEPVNSSKAGTPKPAQTCTGNTANTTTGAATQATSGPNSGSSNQQCQAAPVEYRFCFSPKLLELRAQIDQQAICIGSGTDPNAKSGVTTRTTTSEETTTDKKGVPIKTTTVTVETGIDPSTPPPAGPGALKKGTQESNEPVTGQIGKKTVVGTITLPPSFIEDLIEVATISNQCYPPSSTDQHTGTDDYAMYLSSLPHFRGSRILFTVYTRSTEGILYFLGEVARHYLRSDPPRVYEIKLEKSLAVPRFPEHPCFGDERDKADAGAYSCLPLFVLETGLAVGAPSLSVNYEGQNYTIPAGDAAGDTVHVLSIVKQLLAVNTSAKSLPQTNVLSVISP